MMHFRKLLVATALVGCGSLSFAKTYPVSITLNTPETITQTERDDDRSYSGYSYRTDVKVKTTAHRYKGRLSCSVPKKESATITLEAYFVVRDIGRGAKDRVDGSTMIGSFEFGGTNPRTQLFEFDTPVLEEQKTRDSYNGYYRSETRSESSGTRHIGVIVRALEDDKVVKVYSYPSSQAWDAAGKKEIVTFDKTIPQNYRKSSGSSYGRSGSSSSTKRSNEACVTTRIEGTGKSTPPGWMDDFFEAQDVAAKEGKMMLVVFTGSDWCGPCKQLTENVLKTVKFQNEAKKNYVLVYIDSPNDKSLLSEKCQVQNPEISRLLSVNNGVPDVYIVSADGEKLLRLGAASHLENGVTSYLKFFTGADSALRKIRSVYANHKGSPRNAPELLKELFDVLKQIEPGLLIECFRSEVDSLVSSDPAYGEGFPYFRLYVPLEKDLKSINSDLSSKAYRLARERSGNGGCSSDQVKQCRLELMDTEFRSLYRDLLERVSKNERLADDDQTKNALKKLRMEIFRIINNR